MSTETLQEMESPETTKETSYRRGSCEYKS